jgi:hypothetical protein
MTYNKLRFSPELTYNKDKGACLKAQGIEVVVDETILSIADTKGGITTDAVVSRHSVEALLDVPLDNNHRVTVTIEEVEDDELNQIGDNTNE